MNVVSSSQTTRNARPLVGVAHEFTAIKDTTTVGDLNHNGGFRLATGFHNSVDSAAACAVEGRNGELFVLRVLQQFGDILAHEDTRLKSQVVNNSHL